MTMIKRQLIALVIAVATAASVAVAVPVASARQSNDIVVTNQVRKKLVTLPYYGVFDNLGYKVEGSTVTLYGQVVHPITRKDAARRVARIEGVEQVINQIEVLPLSRFDDSIRLRTYRAVAHTGGLFRYFLGTNPSIHIIVRNGHVALEGVVSNLGDSRLANIAANQVADVFSVTNNLRVEGER
jgi:hyperosmotically inducible periplasmic protein